MMRLLQTSSFIFQKNNSTVTLTRQDFLTNRGYRAGFDVYINFYCDILLVSRLERLNENAVSRRHRSSWRGKANILDWLNLWSFPYIDSSCLVVYRKNCHVVASQRALQSQGGFESAVLLSVRKPTALKKTQMNPRSTIIIPQREPNMIKLQLWQGLHGNRTQPRRM